MKVVQSRYPHYVGDDIEIPAQPNSDHAPFSLYVVYFINCMVNPNYMDWLRHQVKLVEPHTDALYVVATVKEEESGEFTKECLRLFPKAVVTCTFTNQYEYPGILKVWELAQTHRRPNDLVLYFHSKGVTRHDSYKKNENDAYNVVLKDMDRIYDIFATFPTIDKVGYFSGGNGWIWYNFWYARGSYLCQVERPVLTNRRHYYEHWLGRKVPSEQDMFPSKERPLSFYPNTLAATCYGLCTDKTTYGNIGSYYNNITRKMYKI